MTLMTRAHDESERGEVADAGDRARSLLRASADALLDPLVLVEASRDSTGQIVDFVYRELNQATCDYLGVSREGLLGRGVIGTTPGVVESGLFDAGKRCVETGEPLILDDYSYDNEIIRGRRRYDIRATRATPTSVAVTWRDVTERFETAQRISESQEEYHLLAENVGDVVCRLRDDTLIWVSNSVEHILGAPPAHWIGRKAGDFVAVADQADHVARLHQLATGGSVTGRGRVVDADGIEHWVHMLVKPFFDSRGVPDGALASFRLIDDEVAFEAMLAEAKSRQEKADARYRRLMDNSGIGMGLLTPDGRFDVVNEAMCDFFGYDADTLSMKSWQELTAPDCLDADLQKVDDVLAGRIDSYRMAKQYIHADGHLIWGDLSLSCLRGPNGEVENFVSQIIDITKEVQSQQRLALREEQNRLLAQRLQLQTRRLTSGLRSAAAYVASILPNDIEGQVRVSSRHLPSQELAGDCFDYRWVDDDHLIVYLIDVSGHGIEPALLSISVHNMVRSGSLPLATLLVPDQVLSELNRLFQMTQHGDHYFTMWFGVYEVSTRTLRYASAGTPPGFAFIPRSGAAGPITELATPSLPIGMFEATTFTSRSYSVAPGCRVLLFSDGAYELSLAEGGQMSRAEFKSLFTRLAGTSDSSLDDLVEALRSLTPSGTFEDDCSLVQLVFD